LSENHKEIIFCLIEHHIFDIYYVIIVGYVEIRPRT